MGFLTQPIFVTKKMKQDAEYENKLLEKGFTISKKVYQYPSIYVDDVKKQFTFSDRDKIYNYKDLLDYGNEQISSIVTEKGKGSTGKAIIGGLAFGVTGAIVGANMKKPSSQRTITTSETHVMLNDLNNPRITFHYYDGCMYIGGKRIYSLSQKIDEVEGVFAYIKFNSET